MGHLVEYLVEAPGHQVSGIVDAVAPRSQWVQHDDDGPATFEATGLLPCSVHASVAPRATLFAITVKWSWLVGQDAASLRIVADCDAWVRSKFPSRVVLRLDEFVRQRCESEAKREWWQMDHPVDEILARLTDDDHQHFLVINVGSHC